MPSYIVLPDLPAHCPFEVRLNPHMETAGRESEDWVVDGGNLGAKHAAKLRGVKARLLTAGCYPDADFDEFRLCCDVMNWLFHYDNLTDDMDQAGARNAGDIVMDTMLHPDTYISDSRIGKLTRSFWLRFLKIASPGAQKRFIDTTRSFLAAIEQEARDRRAGVIPDLESYIQQRRHTGGVLPCFILAEYASHLTLPDEVVEHPVLKNMADASNDFVCWSNDLFSYNVEQARGDTHNIVIVVMREQNLDLQSAIDVVGEMCKSTIDRFLENQALLPSWGPEIDAQLVPYVACMADWIGGSLNWSYESDRYMGGKSEEVKRTRIVQLLPKKV
ncbi:terpenoid synthase [Punctularia strigosozonata HHB-11173 SS5]|uniref:terpenoid synthase n=1 Tax=Punctularia strigosozonata (strain HHB-11173) TaxID=741275 RepID=UPI000441862A|nr:terpenoid synthase [Punctularia strigosozonata HHB-11173 SS5]EIN08495.1 terpenoid synthase [Punctularia strigosozonata HHB-11173 SS5]